MIDRLGILLLGVLFLFTGAAHAEVKQIIFARQFGLQNLALVGRERRVVELRIKQARFPATRSPDTFGFTAIPSLSKMLYYWKLLSSK